MGNSHNYAFFGETILMVRSSSIEEDAIYLTCIRKKGEKEWEKPSQGEGKTVKISINEISSILLVITENLKDWTTSHTYKGEKTLISVGWDADCLRLEVGDYIHTLKQEEAQVLKVLLKHLLKEKVLYPSELKKKSPDSEEFEKRELHLPMKEQKPSSEKLELENVKSSQEKLNEQIDNVIYEFDTEKAVMFSHSIDDQILWVPKSVLKEGWIKEKDHPQTIELKYVPKNLVWKERIKK